MTGHPQPGGTPRPSKRRYAGQGTQPRRCFSWPGTFRFYIDRLPKDGQRRHYRWRHDRGWQHAGGDHEPGPWSDWADDLPDDVPSEMETGALERLEAQ